MHAEAQLFKKKYTSPPVPPMIDRQKAQAELDKACCDIEAGGKARTQGAVCGGLDSVRNVVETHFSKSYTNPDVITATEVNKSFVVVTAEDGVLTLKPHFYRAQSSHGFSTTYGFPMCVRIEKDKKSDFVYTTNHFAGLKGASQEAEFDPRENLIRSYKVDVILSGCAMGWLGQQGRDSNVKDCYSVGLDAAISGSSDEEIISKMCRQITSNRQLQNACVKHASKRLDEAPIGKNMSVRMIQMIKSGCSSIEHWGKDPKSCYEKGMLSAYNNESRLKTVEAMCSGATQSDDQLLCRKRADLYNSTGLTKPAAPTNIIEYLAPPDPGSH